MKLITLLRLMQRSTMSGVLPLRSLHAFMVSCLGTEAALPLSCTYVVAFVITTRTI
jgi:hypothetical protein